MGRRIRERELPPPGGRRRELLPWVAGALSLVVTAAVIVWTSALFEHDREVERDRQVASVVGDIDDEMARHADLLRTTQGFFDSSRAVEPVEFESFVVGLSLPERFPGTQTIAVAHRRPGTLVVDLVAPSSSAHHARGDDLAEEPAIRDAAERAELTGSVTMSAPVVGSGGERDVFIVEPDDSGRWLLARVRLEPLLARVAEAADPDDDAIAITDVTGGGAQPVGAWDPGPIDDGTTVTADQTVFGREWRSEVTVAGGPSRTGQLVAFGLLGIGVAASVVIISALIAATRSSRRSLALAERASHSEERRRRLVELAPVAIAEVAGSGIVVQANAAARALLGDDGGTPGVALDITTLTDEHRWLVDRIDELHGTPVRIRTDTGDHDVVAYATRVSGELDADHLLVLIDETGRRRLEDRLAEAEKMEALGLLAGGVAHDFNNLLMPIQGFIELVLLNEALSGDDRLSLEEAHAACGRAAALVEQLLTTSTPEVGSGSGDVVAWLRGADSLLRSMVPPEIALDIELPGHEVVAPVRLDATRIEQVIVNLVVNARDATALAGTITVSAAVTGDHVTVRVEDEGGGIDEAARARIFEPFFTTKARRGGTGLGLATVYSTVTKAGGTITVDSELGRGSTFTVELPLVDAPPPDSPAADAPDLDAPALDASAPAAPAADASGAGDGARRPAVDRRATVLVVDDEEYARQLLRQVLADEPYELLVAASAEDAMGLVRTHDRPIDLLVTDVVLGGRSGPDLAEELRSASGALPVIFVSGFVDDQFGPEGSLPEDSWFLAKPFRIDDLRALVRLVLSFDAERR